MVRKASTAAMRATYLRHKFKRILSHYHGRPAPQMHENNMKRKGVHLSKKIALNLPSEVRSSKKAQDETDDEFQFVLRQLRVHLVGKGVQASAESLFFFFLCGHCLSVPTFGRAAEINGNDHSQDAEHGQPRLGTVLGSYICQEMSSLQVATTHACEALAFK